MQFQKISKPTLRMVIGNSEGKGGLNGQIYLRAKLEIPGRWEGSNQKTILGGVMDTSWNHTM